jgi:hypothetical protein
MSNSTFTAKPSIASQLMEIIPNVEITQLTESDLISVEYRESGRFENTANSSGLDFYVNARDSGLVEYRICGGRGLGLQF